MKALILFGKLHTMLHDDDPSFAVPVEAWTPLPEAVVDLSDAAARYLCHNTPWGSGVFDWHHVLNNTLHKRKRDFESAFAKLDARRARSAAAVTEALALGEIPNPADVDTLGQLNMITEENRDILAVLEALTIPDNTDEAAALAVLDVADTLRPWLPAGVATEVLV